MKVGIKIKYALLFILVVLLCNIKTYCFLAEKHDKIFYSIIIGNKTIKRNSKTDSVINALDNASYLAIDQFHGNKGYEKGKRVLSELKKLHIKDLPKRIEDIDFTDNNGKHRRYTHRGWDFDYGENDRANWKVRKKIIPSTVKKVFKKISDNKSEAFAEFIYYIHILGDMEYDIKEGNFYMQNMQIELGGRTDKKDIIDGILDLMPTLFDRERSPTCYKNLRNELVRINTELKQFYIGDNLSSQEQKSKYQSYVEPTEEALKAFIPAMLQNEDFFNTIFY